MAFWAPAAAAAVGAGIGGIVKAVQGTHDPRPEHGREVGAQGFGGTSYDTAAKAMAERTGGIQNPYIGQAMDNADAMRQRQQALLLELTRRSRGIGLESTALGQQQQGQQQNMLQAQTAGARSYNPAQAQASQQAVANVPSQMAAPLAAAQGQERKAANDELLRYLGNVSNEDAMGRMRDAQDEEFRRKQQEEIERFRVAQAAMFGQSKGHELGIEHQGQAAKVQGNN